MQDRPDTTALLDAVTRFLISEVHPRTEDKALAFRVLIAANLVNIVNAELTGRTLRDAAELSRLRALLDDETSTESDPREVLRALNAVLASRIRAGTLDDSPALRVHLRETLREAISVLNARYDLADEIE